MPPCAHTSTDVSPGGPPFRLLFEPVRAASASDEKIGWAAASFSSPGRLVRAGSPGAFRSAAAYGPGPPRSEPSTRGSFRKRACFANLNRASGEKAIHLQQGRRSDMNKKSFPLSRVYG